MRLLNIISKICEVTQYKHPWRRMHEFMNDFWESSSWRRLLYSTCDNTTVEAPERPEVADGLVVLPGAVADCSINDAHVSIASKEIRVKEKLIDSDITSSQKHQKQPVVAKKQPINQIISDLITRRMHRQPIQYHRSSFCSIKSQIKFKTSYFQHRVKRIWLMLSRSGHWNPRNRLPRSQEWRLEGSTRSAGPSWGSNGGRWGGRKWRRHRWRLQGATVVLGWGAEAVASVRWGRWWLWRGDVVVAIKERRGRIEERKDDGSG